MSKPILSGPLLKPGVRAVLLTAKTIGLELEYKESKVEPSEPLKEYSKRKGENRHAVLNDGGKVIWGSHAILAYLISKYGKDDSLYPKDFYKRALVDQMLYFENGVIEARNRLFFLADPENPELVDKYRKALAEAIGYLEKFLEKSDYLAGDDITIADFSAATLLSTINIRLAIRSDEYPKLSDWLNRIESLPYYRDVNETALKRIMQWS